MVLLAIGNYIGQRRSITRQVQAAADAAANAWEVRGNDSFSMREPPVNDLTSEDELRENPYASPRAELIEPQQRRSAFHTSLGLALCCFCGLFVVTIIICLMRQEWDGLLGGLLVTLILGVMARHFLAQRTLPER